MGPGPDADQINPVGTENVAVSSTQFCGWVEPPFNDGGTVKLTNVSFEPVTGAITPAFNDASVSVPDVNLGP